MGGAVSAVTEPVANVVSNVPVVGEAAAGLVSGAGQVVGGVGGTLAGQSRITGQTRPIDKSAFKISEKDEMKRRAEQRREAAVGRSDLAQSQQQQARAGQQNLIKQLQAQASGKAPSLAQAQLKAASDRSLSQQLAAAAAQRGGSPAAVQRALARNQAAQAAQLAQESAQLRLQEQQAAQSQLGSVLQQQRSSDIGTQQAQENLVSSYLSQGFNMQQAQQQASADLQKLETQQFLAAQGLTAAGVAGAQQAQAGLLGSLAGAGGALLAASDKSNKTKVKNYSKGGKVDKYACGGKVKNYKKGGKVAGKAKVEGDSETNDTVNAKLSPGEIVIPRSVAQAGDEAIMGFIKGLKAQSNSNKMAKGGKVSAQKMGQFLNAGLQKSKQAYQDVEQKGMAEFEKYKSMISDMSKKQSVKKYAKGGEVKKDEFNPKNFLDALKAVSYEYKNSHKKNSKGGEGRFLGIMAQDLEKSGAVGKSMVKNTPSGKMVDFGKGFGAILASQAHLNERLSQLEKKRKKKA